MAKTKIINVQGREISLISDQVNDYISLTDMARGSVSKSVSKD